MYIQIGAINHDINGESRPKEQMDFLEAGHDDDAFVYVIDGDQSLVRSFATAVFEIVAAEADDLLEILAQGHEVVCRSDWEPLKYLAKKGVKSRTGYWRGEVVLSMDSM